MAAALGRADPRGAETRVRKGMCAVTVLPVPSMLPRSLLPGVSSSGVGVSRAQSCPLELVDATRESHPWTGDR